MLSTSNGIIVESSHNPFEGYRTRSYAREGQTISEIIAQEGLDLHGSYAVAVRINGTLIDPRYFDHIKPKAGTSVVLSVVPLGGNTGKAVLQILVGILLLVVAFYLLPAAIGLNAGTFGAAAAAIGGISSVAGGIGALVNPPTVPFAGSIPQSQDSPALTGTRNTVRLYGPIRTVLGEYKVYPDLLAKPYTERVGNDSILRMLLCFGYGPLKVDPTQILIGEQHIDSVIDPSKYNILEGWDDDDELTIFRDDVDTDASQNPEFNYEAGQLDVPQGGSTGPIERVSAPGPKELSVDFQFPGGLIGFKKNGKPVDVTVQFQIQENVAGGSYANISDPTAGLEVGNGITQVSPGLFEIKLAERGTITRGLRWTARAGTDTERHGVEVTRVSTTSKSSKEPVSDFRWTILRTIKAHSKSLIPNLAKIELEINASETGLSGIIDNLSAVCTSVVPMWDSLTKSWGPSSGVASVYSAVPAAGKMFPSRNAAWLYAHVLRGPQNSRPVSDNRIDGSGIASWAANLDGIGSDTERSMGGKDNEGDPITRNLDGVIDFSTTTRKVLSDIAGAARASLNIMDGKYSVVQDVPRGTVVQHFTPRNSSNFSGVKAFRERPHALRVNFVNPEMGYQRDEVVVYGDDYSLDGGIINSFQWQDSLSPAGGSGAWTSTRQAQSVGGFALQLTDSGETDPIFQSPIIPTQFSGSEYPYVRVRMRRVTAGGDWEGRFFWTTTDGAETGFSASRQVSTPEPDWSDGWVTLTWDLSSDANWNARTITKFRFDFWSSGTTVSQIDKITADDGKQVATEFAELDLWGVADAHQAYRDGRFFIATAKLRPEVFTISTDIEHLVANRGDLVRVSHDVIGVGFGAARLKEVTNSDGKFESGVMDEGFNVDSMHSYSVRIRLSDGEDIIVPINTGTGSQTEIVATTPVSYGSSPAPAVGDLLLFGVRETESMECIVQRISPRNDLSALIELVEYNAAVYETGTIPEHVSNITLETMPTLVRPITPTIVGSPISDETVLVYTDSGVLEPRILVSVVTPPHDQGSYAPTTHYHAQYRLVNADDGIALTSWVSASRVEAIGDTRIYISPVEEGEAYDIRVRAISDPNATASDWATANGHVVEGMSASPDPPTKLTLIGTDVLSWLYPDPPRDFAGFRVRYQAGTDATWDTGIQLSGGLIPDTRTNIFGIIPPGVQTIMVRAVDIADNESTTLSKVLTLSSPETLYQITGRNFRKSSWGRGTFFNGTVTGTGASAVLEADVDATGVFWMAPLSSFWTDPSADFFTATTFKELTYAQTYPIYDGADHYTVGVAWPNFTDVPCRARFSDFAITGSDYSITYSRAASADASFLTTTFEDGTVVTNTSATGGEGLDGGVLGTGAREVWPGFLDIESAVGNRLVDIGNTTGSIAAAFEPILFVIKICGGKTRGSISAAQFIVEGKPLSFDSGEIAVDDVAGVQVSLAGLGWRKITSVIVTVASESSSQGAFFTEAFDLLALDATAGSEELTGPTVKVYNSSGAPVDSETVTVAMKGY